MRNGTTEEQVAKVAIGASATVVTALVAKEAVNGNTTAIATLAGGLFFLNWFGSQERPAHARAQALKNKVTGGSFFDTCEHVGNNLAAGAEAVLDQSAKGVVALASGPK